MSCWTHVEAVFRIDDFAPFNHKTDFDSVFGKECLWETGDFKDAIKHPSKYLPMGSEGSLQKSVWTNPDHGSLAMYVVTVWGDLRDFDSADEIEKWFRKCCSKFKFTLRQAVCDIKIDNGIRRTIVDNG